MFECYATGFARVWHNIDMNYNSENVTFVDCDIFHRSTFFFFLRTLNMAHVFTWLGSNKQIIDNNLRENKPESHLKK